MNREEALEVLMKMAFAESTDFIEDKLFGFAYSEEHKALQIAIKTLEQTRWIPVSERLPDNAQHKGAFCPKYQVMTKYGVTEGWYNPDYESWYVLLWFMTKRFHETDIDLKRGDIPEVVKIPLKAEIVTAWMPLPESVQVEVKGGEQND